MNIRLKLAAVLLPAYLKRKKFRQLFRLTAQAFQSEMPDLVNLDRKECLHLYGLYTGEEAEKAFSQGDVTAVKSRLFKNGYWFGENFRRTFRPQTMSEIMTAARILYGLLGIDFEGDPQGKIVIRQCFFSRYYSHRACELMSALDQGILAGLSNGGELLFLERMTEGKDCCRAEFVASDESAGEA